MYPFVSLYQKSFLRNRLKILDFLILISSQQNLRQRAQQKPNTIIQIANTAIKNFGGQKQLISNPSAKYIANPPPLNLFLRITLPPDCGINRLNALIHNSQKGAFLLQ